MLLAEMVAEARRPRQLGDQFKAVDEQLIRFRRRQRLQPRRAEFVDVFLHTARVEMVEHARLLQRAGKRRRDQVVLRGIAVESEQAIAACWHVPVEFAVAHAAGSGPLYSDGPSRSMALCSNCCSGWRSMNGPPLGQPLPIVMSTRRPSAAACAITKRRLSRWAAVPT